MIKQYVDFLYPVNTTSEVSEKEIESRKEIIRLPKGAYGYRFFEREETGTEDGITYGIKKNHSGVVYYGTEITLAQLKRESPGENVLIANMEKNGYKRAVKTEFGQYFPLSNSDTVKGLSKKR